MSPNICITLGVKWFTLSIFLLPLENTLAVDEI